MWEGKRPLKAHYSEHLFYEVDYYSDDYLVQAMLLESQKTKRVVIYLRGGKGSVGGVRPVRLMQFANTTTTVIAPYYRGNRANNGKDEFGGRDLEDVRAVARYISSIYGDVPLHIVGFSRGGIQGLLTYQDVNAASYINYAGVSDIYEMYNERQDLRGMMKRLIGKPDQDVEAYNRRNGYMHIRASSPPVLIIHGTKDKQVNIKHAEILKQRLEELDVMHDYLIYKDEGHVLRPLIEQVALEVIQRWMDDIEQRAT